jgi:dynein heavy chain
LRTRTKDEVLIIQDIVNQVFDKTYNYVVQSLHPQMELLPNAYLETLTSLLTGLLHSGMQRGHMQKIALFCLTWSLGSLLENEDRGLLQGFLWENFRSCLPFPDFSTKSEDQRSLFDYHVDAAGTWQHWSSKLGTAIPKAAMFVPTTENLSISFLLNTLVTRKKPVLLIGEPGTAKTTMLSSFVESLGPDEYLFKQLALSSTTSTSGFQKMMESSLDKKMGNTFGPPNGKSMCFFLDDFSIPDINQWGDQPTLEIMRQLLEYEGFYSLDRPGKQHAEVDRRSYKLAH